MNQRYVVAFIVILIAIVLAFVLFLPGPKKTPGPDVASSSATPAPTAAIPQRPAPAAEVAPQLDETDPFEVIEPQQPEPNPTEITQAGPTPTLTAEQAQRKLDELISQFAKAVESRNEAEINRIIQELVALGDISTEILGQYVIKHPDADVREYAAQALAQIGSVAAIGELLTAIHQETDMLIKENLRKTLRTVTNPAAISIAVEGLIQQDIVWWHEDAKFLLLSLEKYGSADALLEYYQNTPDLSADASERIRDALSSLQHESSIALLIDVLTASGSDSDLRAAAAGGLASIGTPNAVETLLSQTTATSDADLRNRYLASISGITNKDCVDTLHNTLSSSAPDDVRVAAANALSMSQNEPSVQKLWDLYEKDPSEEVRQAIAATLERIGSKQH